MAHALRVQEQREAEERLAQRHDRVMTNEVNLGTRYVDPKNPHGNRKYDEPYTSLDPYLKDTERLERIARPWLFTDAAIIRRRELEEEREFMELEKVMARAKA